MAGSAGQECAPGLTPDEAQVVRLVAQGLTTRRIARSLHLSVRTVDRRVGRAMRRTGCPSRAALAVWAARRGLL